MRRVRWLKKSILILSILLAVSVSVSVSAIGLDRAVTGYVVEGTCLFSADGASDSCVPTEAEAYERMIALKDQYPEGLRWTNNNYYEWNGGIYLGGYGCAAFTFILSDAAFGDLPAKKLTEFAYEDLKVGDILRIKNDTHSVSILEIHEDYVVVAEGNYNRSIHWGRTLGKGIVMNANYVLTRYPDCTITFDPNGGTVKQTSMAAAPGDCYGELPIPVREGYQFLGWYTDPEEGVQILADDVIGQFTEQVLYAHWEPYALTEGSMGAEVPIVWSYVENTGEITVTGDLGEGGKVMVASFDENGRLLSFDLVAVSGETARTDTAASQIGLFWLDGDNCPQCEQAEIIKE